MASIEEVTKFTISSESARNTGAENISISSAISDSKEDTSALMKLAELACKENIDIFDEKEHTALLTNTSGTISNVVPNKVHLCEESDITVPSEEIKFEGVSPAKEGSLDKEALNQYSKEQDKLRDKFKEEDLTGASTVNQELKKYLSNKDDFEKVSCEEMKLQTVLPDDSLQKDQFKEDSSKNNSLKEGDAINLELKVGSSNKVDFDKDSYKMKLDKASTNNLSQKDEFKVDSSKKEEFTIDSTENLELKGSSSNKDYFEEDSYKMKLDKASTDNLSQKDEFKVDSLKKEELTMDSTKNLELKQCSSNKDNCEEVKLRKVLTDDSLQKNQFKEDSSEKKSMKGGGASTENQELKKCLSNKDYLKKNSCKEVKLEKVLKDPLQKHPFKEESSKHMLKEDSIKNLDLKDCDSNKDDFKVYSSEKEVLQVGSSKNEKMLQDLAMKDKVQKELPETENLSIKELINQDLNVNEKQQQHQNVNKKFQKDSPSQIVLKECSVDTGKNEKVSLEQKELKENPSIIKENMNKNLMVKEKQVKYHSLNAELTKRPSTQSVSKQFSVETEGIEKVSLKHKELKENPSLMKHKLNEDLIDKEKQMKDQSVNKEFSKNQSIQNVSKQFSVNIEGIEKVSLKQKKLKENLSIIKENMNKNLIVKEKLVNDQSISKEFPKNPSAQSILKGYSADTEGNKEVPLKQKELKQNPSLMKRMMNIDLIVKRKKVADQRATEKLPKCLSIQNVSKQISVDTEQIEKVSLKQKELKENPSMIKENMKKDLIVKEMLVNDQSVHKEFPKNPSVQSISKGSSVNTEGSEKVSLKQKELKANISLIKQQNNEDLMVKRKLVKDYRVNKELAKNSSIQSVSKGCSINTEGSDKILLKQKEVKQNPLLIKLNEELIDKEKEVNGQNVNRELPKGPSMEGVSKECSVDTEKQELKSLQLKKLIDKSLKGSQLDPVSSEKQNLRSQPNKLNISKDTLTTNDNDHSSQQENLGDALKENIEKIQSNDHMHELFPKVKTKEVLSLTKKNLKRKSCGVRTSNRKSLASAESDPPKKSMVDLNSKQMMFTNVSSSPEKTQSVKRKLDETDDIKQIEQPKVKGKYSIKQKAISRSNPIHAITLANSKIKPKDSQNEDSASSSDVSGNSNCHRSNSLLEKKYVGAGVTMEILGSNEPKPSVLPQCISTAVSNKSELREKKVKNCNLQMHKVNTDVQCLPSRKGKVFEISTDESDSDNRLVIDETAEKCKYAKSKSTKRPLDIIDNATTKQSKKSPVVYKGRSSRVDSAETSNLENKANLAVSQLNKCAENNKGKLTNSKSHSEPGLDLSTLPPSFSSNAISTQLIDNPHQDICIRCANIWNDKTLGLLFQGSVSVTVNSKITYGSILRMNYYASIHFPGKQEETVKGLVGRADLCSKLGPVKVSKLSNWLSILIKQKQIKCCDPFRPIYRYRSESSKTDAPHQTQADKCPLEACQIKEKVSKMPLSQPSPPKESSASKSIKTDHELIKPQLIYVTKDDKTNAVCVEKILQLTDRFTIGELLHRKREASLDYLYEVVSIEEKSLSEDFRRLFLLLLCSKKIDRDRKCTSNEEMVEISSAFAAHNANNMDHYYKFVCQLLYHRNKVLLIPFDKELNEHMRAIQTEINANQTCDSENLWDESQLYSAPLNWRDSFVDKLPTVRDVLSRFCLMRNRPLLHEKEIPSNIIISLKSMMHLGNVKDNLGLCIRLYAKYCKFAFEQKELKKAAAFLDLIAFPPTSVIENVKMSMISSNMNFLPRHNYSLDECITHCQSQLIDQCQIKRNLSTALLDVSCEEASLMKTNVLKKIKDPLLAVNLTFYVKSKTKYLKERSPKKRLEANEFEPCSKSSKVDSDVPPISEVVKQIICKLLSQKIELDDLHTIVNKIFTNILKKETPRLPSIEEILLNPKDYPLL